MRPLAFLSPEFAVDPWPLYASFRRERSVWWAEEIRMFCVFGYEETRQVLTNPAFTVEYPFRVSQQVFGRTLLDVDGPDHRRVRAVVTPLFARVNVEQMMGHVVKPVVTEVLESLRGREQLDFMRDIAEVLPAFITCRLLGVDDSRVAIVIENLNYLIHHLDGSRGDFARASATRQSLEAQLEAALAAALPREDYRNIASVREELGGEEPLRMMMLMLAAGVETSVCALGNMLSTLLRHPEWLQRMRVEPTLVPAVVAETLRWEPPQHDTVRFARVDQELGGVKIRAGQAVKVLLASANRDDRVFPSADLFRPGREPKALLSFGYGPHMCLGRALAVSELEHVLRTLLATFDSIVSLEQAVPRPAGFTFRRPTALPIGVTWRKAK